MRSGLTVAALLGYLVEPKLAQACAGSVCINDQFLPRVGSVPENIATIAWDPGYDVRAEIPLLPRLECVAADGGTRELSFAALPRDRPDHLELNEPLVAGERCMLSSGVTDCSVDGAGAYLEGRAEFDVVDSSPLPEELGLIAVAGPKLDDIEISADTSCSERVSACIVNASVVFSAAALPWKDALLFETIVDGEPFSTSRNLALPDELGGLYHGRTADVVYALGGKIPGNVIAERELDPGEHTLAIRARLPGSDVILATPPVTINLDCGRRAQVPLARSEVSAGSNSCTVTPDLGSSHRRSHFACNALAGIAALLLARRRARQKP
jgi:hypothetical protein